MKFLKFILSIPYAAIAGWLLWLLFTWIIPAAMDLSWVWFIVYCILAGGFIGTFFQFISAILAVPSAWLCKDNIAAKIVQVLIFGFFGYSSLSFLWSVMPHGLLQWLVALSFTIIVLISYIGLMGVAFTSSDEDGE